MTAWVYINEIGNYVEREVEIRGWLYNKRSSGSIHFLILRDGTGFLQGVVNKDAVTRCDFEQAISLSLETSLVVKGRVKPEPRAPGGYELVIKELEVFASGNDFPIGKKEHGVGFLLQNRHLWLRSKKQWAILRIRHEVEKSINDFFVSRGFYRIDSPILTPSACEGTTTLFKTDYFGEEAYLTQSGQLYLEAACLALGKVFSFGPTFRAEKSKTRRHLTEFWMVEPEIAWINFRELMQLAENFVADIVTRILETSKEELKILEREIEKLEAATSLPYPKITYDEVVKLFNFKGGEDFGGDEETVISQKYSQPVIIYHYPAKIKAFYMKRDSENPELVQAFDMLASEGYGEIIGGSQREDDLKCLQERLGEYNLPQEAYEWYLDLRRYGSCPHGGFGLGLERTIAWITGIHHLRETIPFPRMLEKIYP